MVLKFNWVNNEDISGFEIRTSREWSKNSFHVQTSAILTNKGVLSSKEGRMKLQCFPVQMSKKEVIHGFKI